MRGLLIMVLYALVMAGLFFGGAYFLNAKLSSVVPQTEVR